jgi:hypothetical protein
MNRLELMDWLTHQEGTTALAWLYRAWEGLEYVPPDFSWQSLAAAADVLAKSGQGPNYYSQPDLEWAKVTIAICQHCISTAGPRERLLLEQRIMELRAYLIVRLDNVAGDPILDAQQIVEWFFRTIPLSPDEVERKAASVRELEDKELFLLGYIKSTLPFLQWLSDHKLLPPNPELDRWLALRMKLP